MVGRRTKATALQKWGKRFINCVLSLKTRPVSLTSIPCKVLESLLRDQLLEHVKVHNLASKHQHGFTSGRSCFRNWLGAIEDWTRTYDESVDVDIVYLDYRRAFDTVPHKRLVKKLKAYGNSGTSIGWIESFLTKRQMRVLINGKMSRWIDVLSSVPQGSVLGPLLFLLFVIEIPDLVGSSVKLFANDTKVWRVIRKQTDSQCKFCKKILPG